MKRLKPRKPLGHEVHETLRKAIIVGDLEPGQRLIEEQLAESLGASRTPVRQAMHVLEREGLVERLERGGFAVKGLSVEDINEIFDLRAVLESFAARRAAEKITPGAINLLTRHNEAFQRAVENEKSDQLAALNTEFHEALYSLADNQRLRRIIGELRDHFYRYRVVLLQLQDMAQASYNDHKEMIQAMEARDIEKTEKLVRAHILKGKEAILSEVGTGERVSE